MSSSRIVSRLFVIAVAVALIAGVVTHRAWWPAVEARVQAAISSRRPAADEHSHEHDGHDHAHGAGDSLTLTPQAMKGLGLTDDALQPLKLTTYRRTITVPGIVVERPGRTRVEASTPIAGVITHVHAVQGETVAPGTLLFQMRITANALVSTQTDLLRTVGELDVENREIARLTKAIDSGSIPSKTLLERQYAKEKLESALNAQREGLRLLGLSERQIEDIVTNRRVLKELQITAPERDEHSDEELKLTDKAIEKVSYSAPAPAPSHAHNGKAGPLVLRDVRVHKGQTVNAGDTLAVMTDYSELFVEGRAFEQDARWMTDAARRNWTVSALVDDASGKEAVIDGLQFAFTGSEIDHDSRTLPFYVRLPNTVERTVTMPDGQQFNDWRYRLGQRMQLRIPVEEWTNKFVLPIEAVARDGLDWFVFRQNGSKFDRVRVTVDYRDSTSVVIANDSQLYPGNTVALRGAHQMQMALKNRSGGAIDPHAGHNH